MAAAYAFERVLKVVADVRSMSPLRAAPRLDVVANGDALI
jgi:hypothetical protein